MYARQGSGSATRSIYGGFVNGRREVESMIPMQYP